jgi:RNA polymerase sigma factor (sigma-70 family)
VQDVFAVLVQKMDRYDPARGRFRTWLRTVCHNKWRDRQRPKDAQLAQAKSEDLAELAADADMDAFWEAEHNAFLVRQALLTFEDLREVLTAKSVDMGIALLVEGQSIAEVAERFEVSANAVRLVKLKVVRRLRQELSEFLD